MLRISMQQRSRKNWNRYWLDAKVKTVPVSILGSAEQAPLALIVTGPELDSVMVFAKAAMNELKNVKGATEMKTFSGSR